MKPFNPTDYPPAVAALLAAETLPELGPGKPNLTVKPLLDALRPESLGEPVRDRPMALACISGLWLLHDFLDESHTISQELPSPTGSYWHGIMHRREPDAANSKYWFRQVGDHPVSTLLVAEFGKWDSFKFVDRCEACRDTGSEEEMECRRLQRREWQVLFDWCWKSGRN